MSGQTSFSLDKMIVNWDNISHQQIENESWTLLNPVYEVDKHSVKKPVDDCTSENIRYIEFTPKGVSFAQMNGMPMHNTQ